ncbi:MAG: hypothetical protein ACYS5V_00585 [Planctomycetota bacterium]|jgi:hypothetical protein
MGKWIVLGALVGIVLAAGIGTPVYLVFSGPPGYVRKTKEFRAEMAQQANVAAIRTWAQSYTVSPLDTSYGPGSVDVGQARWPTCIGELDPQFVWYDPQDKVVVLVYGGGFGHWGLTVGPRGATPGQFPDIPLQDHVLPLADGAWVWHEIQ